MEIQTTLFIALFAVAIGESIMLGTWKPLAFRSGIVVFRRKLSGAQVSDISTEQLQSEFSKSLAPSILFHKHNEKEIFFREKLISFSLFSYTPIMHGHIARDLGGGVFLTGRLNWFSVVFAVAWYSFVTAFPWNEVSNKDSTPNQEAFFVFLIFPILVYLMLYLIQSYRFKNIANEINLMGRHPY